MSLGIKFVPVLVSAANARFIIGPQGHICGVEPQIVAIAHIDAIRQGTMSGSPISLHWEPIKDLPENWPALARPDLDESLRLWRSEREALRDSGRAAELEERLARLWAIETGVIERLYTIDRGTTESLVELGLGALQQFSTTGRITPQAAALIEDQRAALDFVFAFLKDERPLSISYIKELHQLLLQHEETSEAIDQFGRHFETELIRGDWKRHPNNPLTPDGTVHQYAPPEFVQEEMERLMELHLEHEQRGVRPEVEAAWLHHRFTQIHPFQDGNGRVARALATLVFLKAGYLPLVIRSDMHRDRYLDALERADEGNPAPLVGLFSNIQSTDLDEAITFVRSMRGEGIDAIARAAADAAKRRFANGGQLHQLTNHLLALAEESLDAVRAEVRKAFQEAGVSIHAFTNENGTEDMGWWSQQILFAASKHSYAADVSAFRRWVLLELEIEGADIPVWYLVVSLHHKQSRTDLMAAEIFLTNSAGWSESAPLGFFSSAEEWTYSAESAVAEESFRKWLNTRITELLGVWQSRL